MQIRKDELLNLLLYDKDCYRVKRFLAESKRLLCSETTSTAHVNSVCMV